MSNSETIRFVICICLTSIVLLIATGCASKPKAVDLYVDAVMLKGFDENEKAVEKLNSAVELNKDFSLAYSLLGEIYQEIKDYEKSATAYENATKLNQWSFKDYFNLGRVYQIMKKFALAVKAYTIACELKPEHLAANVNAAKCYYEIEDYNNALVYGGRAEQIDPNASEVQSLLGDIYESQKNYGRAVCSYKRAMEKNSKNVSVMTSLAVTYLKTDRNSSAEELLNSVIQIDPNNNTAYKYLGYCHLMFYEQTTKEYKNVPSQDSNSLAASRLFYDMKSAVGQSIESYSRAIEIDDKDWDAHRGLGVAYMLKAKNKDGTTDELMKQKAVRQWQLSLQIKPDQPRHERLLKLIQVYSK